MPRTTCLKPNPNRIKNLNINCTPEHGMQIVEKYAGSTWEELKKIDFPFPEYDEKRCRNEWKKLLSSDAADPNPKAQSSIIRMMHPSMFMASRGKHMSPYAYWYEVQNNFEEFKKFYFNRLTRSDWFKIDDRKETWMEKGKVPLSIWFCGLTTSGKAPCVSYFKPLLAKYLVKKYLNEYDTVFDPFSGYSGRMLGALAAGKNYIGQDLNARTVAESCEIFKKIKEFSNGELKAEASVSQGDSLLKHAGKKYRCLFTCSPYADIEHYNENEVFHTCDEWIDICLENFDAGKYLFVTDDKISKWKGNVVETITNTCHWGTNEEYAVLIEKQ